MYNIFEYQKIFEITIFNNSVYVRVCVCVCVCVFLRRGKRIYT